MYADAGYLNDADIEIEDNSHPLMVSGCGVYRLIRQPDMTTVRPDGRKDYQLLYIASGKAFFHLNCGLKEAARGCMILYRPGESQHYYYYARDNSEVCWIHFSGYEAGAVLDKIGFGNSQILYCGNFFNFFELFRGIILELQLKRPCFEEFLSLYLRQLFAGIERTQLDLSMEKSTENSFSHRELEATVHYFNESFAKDICIEEYAKNQHMSVCWFIRSFKRYMGVTPMQYVTSIRINKAKELLKNTNYSIQEISGLVGYENPLYFSRIFRKQIGCSPSGYRKG